MQPNISTRNALMRRHELTDEQFDIIKHFLPGTEATAGVTAQDNRLFVNAVIWVFKTGAHGEIFLKDLVIGTAYTNVLQGGLSQVFLTLFFASCLRMLIWNFY